MKHKTSENQMWLSSSNLRCARLFLLSISIALAAGCGSDSQSNEARSFDETPSTNSDSGAIVSVSGADNRIFDVSKEIAVETDRVFVNSLDKPVESLTSADTILVDLSDEMDVGGLNYLAGAARRDATIVLKNTDTELMNGFALVTGDDIDTMVISNSNGGTTQYVEYTGRPDSDPDMRGESSGRNTAARGAPNSAATLVQAKQREVSPLSAKTIADIIRRIEKSRPTDNTRAQSEPAKIASRSQMSARSARVAPCPIDVPALICESEERSQSQNVVKNTMSVASVTVNMISDTVSIAGSRPPNVRQAILDAVLNVEIVAPANERQKYVKVDTRGSFVNVQGMTSDSPVARFPFTIEGRIMYYPVNNKYGKYLGFGDPYRLPAGWSILDSVPATTDQRNTYVTTTGWSTSKGHAVEVGGSISATGPEVSASYRYNVEFGSNGNRQERILSRAIRVENNSAYKSDTSWKYSGWDNPDDLVSYGILPIAPAAKTRINMKSETVYRVPVDEKKIEFAVRARHTLGGILYGPVELMNGSATQGDVNLFDVFQELSDAKTPKAVVNTTVKGVKSFVNFVKGGKPASAIAQPILYRPLFRVQSHEDARTITLNLDLVQPLGDRGWRAKYKNCPDKTATLDADSSCETLSSELLAKTLDIKEWPKGLPDSSSVPDAKDPHYAKYEGWVKAEYSGKYTFLLTNTNTASLFIGPAGGSRRVITRSSSHFDSFKPMEKRGDIYLKEGEYYRVAVYHHVPSRTAGNDVPSIKLSWSHYDDNDEARFFEQTVPWRLTHSGKYY